MLYLILICLYCIISLIGSVVYQSQHSNQLTFTQKLSLSYFTMIHILFLMLTVLDVIHVYSSNIAYLSIMIFVLLARMINGRIVFYKNNWHHYVILGGIFALLFTFYVFDI
ncbi:hypothetical protein [Ornithinibacillus xuwenensis]|uniref:DUF4181 domain-containing protein n=1 Tax=Ornithinibacillus xuwenensis TaxID=3144668 RepID=A0ABU9XGJ6_9BACI